MRTQSVSLFLQTNIEANIYKIFVTRADIAMDMFRPYLLDFRFSLIADWIFLYNYNTGSGWNTDDNSMGTGLGLSCIIRQTHSTFKYLQVK